MLNKKSILVLDDDMDLANIFKIALQRQGLSVDSFTDPVLALDHFIANDKNYSLILIDLRMPAINGIEFANMVRKLNDKIKIILMTAFTIGDLNSIPEFITANITKVIEKPISLPDLLRIIKEFYK